ncbi:PSD1 and planctomycete cytochrome C domain-containing protein [Planctomicrobium sp. SH661]|uniref:PSD1 and planctomycete cytochrome C domain-containing protein n=1 Tax=Planctomicrobium sp. SH661 TaxID=3448124 RepID=UPI003F5B07C3
MMSTFHRILIGFLFWGMQLPQCCNADDDLFNSSIRALLEKKCLSCHNSSDHKGGLSLETSELMSKGGESGPIIAAGHPDSSYLVELITPHNGKSEMPKGAPSLTSEEIAAVREWIQQGAVWPSKTELQPEVWWSLQPLAKPEVPVPAPMVATNGDVFRIRTPIDAFIQEKWRRHGLVPAPEADRRILIRRLYFDLIGLPPTPEEIEEFIHDPAPLAYENRVDKLLDSPHYGERWARHWLDVARYADTCGYDKDKLRRNAWPYRDYVIRSLNEDKRYDRFVQEQIAGDVMFPGTQDGILGLGFIAAGPWDNIGHTEVPESKIDGQIARNLDRDEMVTGALNAFCSTTVQCARCHNHKFDPITQAHYYGLQAVFAAVDRADREYANAPESAERRLALEASRREQLQRLNQIDEQIKHEMEASGDDRHLAELDAHLARLKSISGRPQRPVQYGYHSHIESRPDAAKWIEFELPNSVAVSRIVLHPCYDEFAGIGAGFGFPVRFRIELATERRQLEKDGKAALVIDQTSAPFTNPEVQPVEFVVEATGIRWVRITATQLAERTNDYIFALAEVEIFDEKQHNLAPQSQVSALDTLEFPVRWSLENLTDDLWPQLLDDDVTLEYELTFKERSSILEKYETPERQNEREQCKLTIEQIDNDLKGLPAGPMVYAAATDFTPQGAFNPTRGRPREVRILHRGNVQQPKELAVPGALPFIPGVPAQFELPADHTEGDRRAALAEWVTRRDHPLTWRSIVNRVWQFHFGEGIAASPNDFGRMGKEPTHPELLDWLAVEFRDGDQSLKQLHRLIVNSSVYRQSSADHPANSAIDGSNQFLWRMNRRRLEAEEIRDAILSVSGSMNLKMGGPGFFLFNLEKEVHSPHYEYQSFDPADPASHRRSIYRFIVRSQPDPFMTTLDCADSSQSTPRRNETVTALQALALLNNRFNLLMAERLAARLESGSSDPEEQIRSGFSLVTGRPPAPDELHQLHRFASEHGLKSTCRLLFNLNEFVYID